MINREKHSIENQNILTTNTQHKICMQSSKTNKEKSPRVFPIVKHTTHAANIDHIHICAMHAMPPCTPQPVSLWISGWACLAEPIKLSLCTGAGCTSGKLTSLWWQIHCAVCNRHHNVRNSHNKWLNMPNIVFTSKLCVCVCVCVRVSVRLPACWSQPIEMSFAVWWRTMC